MRKIHIVMLLIFHFSIFGQQTNEVVCNLKVEIISKSLVEDSAIFSMYNNICKITQSIQIQYEQQDTICFVLDKPSQISFLNSLYFQKLTVKNNKIKIPYIFESNMLKFVLPKEDCVIEIEYYYHPDYFYFGNENMTCVFAPYQQSWFSWYFSIPNMKINNIIFDIPEHLYFFSNVMRKKSEEKQICLSFDSIPETGISFFWVEKRFYEQVVTKIQNNQYNLYFFKDIVLTGDSSSCDVGMLPSQRVDNNMIDTHIAELNRAVHGIEEIFNKDVNFDIIEACLDISQDDDVTRWGSAFLLSESQVLIFMDTSFWKNQNCVHEIVHAYNNILPSKNDSSYYFFHESMTEYLAIYFRYSQQKSRDSIFEAKMLKYANLQQDYNSIFEIDKNEITLDFGGTFGVMYLKTPSVINSFAKKIGEDKFIEILSHFYKKVQETKLINFQEFENFFKSNGASNQDWEWFIKQLF